MSGEPTFKFLPLMSDHNLTYSYGYSCLLMGQGCEAWLVWALSDWITGVKAELERRGLLKDAKRTYRLLLKEYHARAGPLDAPSRWVRTPRTD